MGKINSLLLKTVASRPLPQAGPSLLWCRGWQQVFRRRLFIFPVCILFSLLITTSAFAASGLKEDVEYLSSVLLKGRGFGSPGAVEASWYVLRRFDAAGLKTSVASFKTDDGVVGHNKYGAAAFANIDIIPVEQIALGFEYKQGVHVGDGITNHDYFDGHVAWFVTDTLTLVGAYAYTGDKDKFYRYGKTKDLGVGGGFVLSIQYQF